MLYGLLAIALILSLPACQLRKSTDQGCTDDSCQQAAPAEQMEEVEVTETVVPDESMPDMPAEGDMSSSQEAAE